MTVRAAWLIGVAGCLAKPGFECEITGAEDVDAPHLGANGGTPQAPQSCGEGFAVGVAVALTAAPDHTFGNEYIVAQVSMLCAVITDRDGEIASGAPTPILVAQGGLEIQAAQTATCASGAVLLGIDAHLITVDGLFNTVSIECAALTEAATPAAKLIPIAVPNTGSDVVDSHVICPPGAAVDGMRGWAGNEVDQLELACAAPACKR